MGTDLFIRPTDVYIVDKNNHMFMHLTELARYDLSAEQYLHGDTLVRYTADVDATVCKLHVEGDKCDRHEYDAGIDDDEFENVLFGGEIVG